MKLFSRNKPAEEKPELIDYLESLPEVDVPFQPFSEEEPVVAFLLYILHDQFTDLA